MFEAQKLVCTPFLSLNLWFEYTSLSWGFRSKAVIMHKGRAAVQLDSAFTGVSMHVIVQKADGSSHLDVCVFLTENLLHGHESWILAAV
jgi:hypothetical protein